MSTAHQSTITEQALLDRLQGTCVEVYDTMRVIRGYHAVGPLEQSSYLEFLRMQFLQVRLFVADYKEQHGSPILLPPLADMAMQALDSVWFGYGIKSLWREDECLALYLKRRQFEVETIIFDCRERCFVLGKPSEFWAVKNR